LIAEKMGALSLVDVELISCASSAEVTVLIADDQLSIDVKRVAARASSIL